MKKLSELTLKKKIFMAGVAFLALLVMLFASTLKGQVLKRVEVGAQVAVPQSGGRVMLPGEVMAPSPAEERGVSGRQPTTPVSASKVAQLSSTSSELHFWGPTGKKDNLGRNLDDYILEIIVPQGTLVAKGELLNLLPEQPLPLFLEKTGSEDGKEIYTDRFSIPEITQLIKPGQDSLTTKLTYLVQDQEGKTYNVASAFKLKRGPDPEAYSINVEKAEKDIFGELTEALGVEGATEEIDCDDYKKSFGVGRVKVRFPRIKSVICEVIVWIGEFHERVIGSTSQWALNVISDYSERAGTHWLADWVKKGWDQAVKFVDVLAIIALIIVAFANILHLNLNVYAIKRMLPIFVIALIAANLSLFIMQSLSGLGYVLAHNLVGSAGEGFKALAMSIENNFTSLMVDVFLGSPSPTDSNMGDIMYRAGEGIAMIPIGFAAGLAMLLLMIVGFILAVIISFLIFIQPGVVGLLTIVAPIAIMCAVLPFTEAVFKKWLSLIFNWVFMLPVVLLLFSLMNVVAPARTAADLVGASATLANLFGVVAQVIILFFAVRLPFKMGGDIAAAWGAAGKFAGSWIGRKLEVGATSLVTQARTIEEEAKRRAKLGGPGITPQERRQAGWKKRLGGMLMTYNPSSILAGFRERAESEKKGIEAMRQVTSRSYQKIVGPGVIFDLNYEGEVEKAMERSDEENRAMLEAYRNRYGWSEEQFKINLLMAMRNTKGKISGLIKSNAYLQGVEDPEAFVATAKGLFSQGGRTHMGYLMHPSGTQFYEELGLAREFPATALAAWLADVERDTPEYGARLESISTSLRTQIPLREDLIKQGVPEDQAGARIAEANVRMDRQIERLERLADNWRERGRRRERGAGYGEEGPPPMATAEEANQVRREREEFGAVQAFLTGGALPVRIVQDGNLLVADRLAETSLTRAAFQLRRQAETLGETEEGQRELGRLIEQTWLNPQEIFGGLGRGEIGTGLHPDLRTGLGGLAGQASRREELLGRTARVRAESRMLETVPYMISLSEQVRNKKVNLDEIGTIDKRIQETLEAIEQGRVAPGALTQLRNDLRLIVPSPTLNLPTLSQAALYQAGQRARSVISQLSSPEVRRIVETGASAGQVQETLLRAETSRQLRSHALHRLQANLTPLRREGVPAAELATEITNRVASFMRNSPQVSQQFVRLPGERQVEIARQVAQSLISETRARERPLDESVLNQRVGEAIRGAVGRGPVPAGPQPAPATPPPSAKATGGKPAPSTPPPTGPAT